MGTLEKGKITNILILDKNPFDVPDNQIKDINVETVIFDGKTIKGSI